MSDETNVWGCNPADPALTPVAVRDALVRCFSAAHADALHEGMSAQVSKDDPEFKTFAVTSVAMQIEQMFKKVGGDFNQPTKEGLMAVMNELVAYAKFFRDPSVIQQHYEQMMKLMKALP